MEHHKLYCEDCQHRTVHEAEIVNGVKCWFCMTCGAETLSGHKPKLSRIDEEESLNV